MADKTTESTWVHPGNGPAVFVPAGTAVADIDPALAPSIGGHLWADGEPVQASGGDEGGERLERPAASAKKAEWVAYGEQEGVTVDGAATLADATVEQIVAAVDAKAGPAS